MAMQGDAALALALLATAADSEDEQLLARLLFYQDADAARHDPLISTAPLPADGVTARLSTDELLARLGV